MTDIHYNKFIMQLQWLYSLLLKADTLFFPKLCFNYDINCPNSLHLCSDCAVHLPWLNNTCQQCATPLAIDNHLQRCTSCICSPPPFDHTLVLFAYQAPINYWISALKFKQQLHYAKLFGLLLAQRIQEQIPIKQFPEIIIAVPLHRQRFRQRGFNQAYEIAKVISRQLAIPLNYSVCQRIKAAQAQSQTTSQQQRFHNVHDAFKCQKLNVKRIAIVDDVMTSGATVTALAQCLRQQGATDIYIWCCARA